MSEMDASTDALDAIAEDWCEESGFERVLVHYRTLEVREHARGHRLLDLGCGVGCLCRSMADKMDVVVGVDGSAKKIARAQALTHQSHVRFVHGLFDKVAINEVFDTIVMTNVLEHVGDPVGLLRRAEGWLAPSGVIIATVPNALGLHKRIGRAMGLIDDFYALTPADLAKGHQRIYDAHSLRADVESAGLRVAHLLGLFLKPLSSRQMEQFDEKLFDALYVIGRELPEYCSSLLVCAERGES